MQQRSQTSKKEEKNKTDGKGKWEEKDQKKLFLAEFQLTFVLLIIIKKIQIIMLQFQIKKLKEMETAVS